MDMNKESIPGVHIRNITSEVIAAADIDGNFSIAASIGDTLIMTSVGYRQFMVTVDENWKGRIMFFLQEGSIELEEATWELIGSLAEDQLHLMWDVS